MNKNKDISIIIPAFNEAKELPLFLDKLISYCNKSENIYEIIVVDDGSNDKTLDIATSYRTQFSNLHTIEIGENKGKGHAVKRGILEATGEVGLFLDADGSVNPEEIEKNLSYIKKEGYDIFVGSRVLKNKEQILKIRWYRKLIGTIFNFLTRILLFNKVKDTQCGFKMFKGECIKPLFSKVRLGGFGFDLEALYLAYKMGYKIKEGPVSWHHVDGSKVNLFTDSIKIFFNIFQIKNWYHSVNLD